MGKYVQKTPGRKIFGQINNITGTKGNTGRVFSKNTGFYDMCHKTGITKPDMITLSLP